MIKATSRAEPIPARKRRWQFSLRGLFVIAFGAACFCAGWRAKHIAVERAEETQLKAYREAEAEWFAEMERQRKAGRPNPFAAP